MEIDAKRSGWAFGGLPRFPPTHIANAEYVENVMDHLKQRMELHRDDRRHLADLALEAAWSADDETNLDADHARALSQLGFGFSGGRFPTHAHVH